MYQSAEIYAPEYANSVPSPQPQPLDQFFMWRVLDEIDYGLILASPDGQLQHTDHLGRYELVRTKFLRTSSAVNEKAKGLLQTNGAAATADLLCGICAAARGRRQMLTLHHGSESLSLACVPLFQPIEGAYHHIAPTSASFKHRWWQSDIGWAFIRLAGHLGLASNIKRHQG